MEKVREQTGKTPALLEPIEIPETARYLWGWFSELAGGRQYSEMGPMTLTYNEIKAWSDLTQAHPSAWEVATIKEIDSAYLAELMKK